MVEEITKLAVQSSEQERRRPQINLRERGLI